MKTTKRVANGTVRRRRRPPGAPLAAGAVGPLSPGGQHGSDRNGPVTSVAFDAGWYADASADTPDLLEVALDKPEYAPGDTHEGRGHGAHRRQGDAQRGRATG